MKKTFLTLAIMCLLSASALAQSGERRGWGYAFGGIGGASGGEGTFAHLGGGGEAMLYKNFGLGAELGYLAPISGNFGDGLGMLSVNPAGHFNRSGKVSPFVTGGFSLAILDGGAAGGGNVGGGVQYWVNKNAAVRFEYRAHIFSSDSPYLHTFRVGVSFR